MTTFASRRLGRVPFAILWVCVAVITRILALGTSTLIGFIPQWDLIDAAGQALALGALAVSWTWWWAGATVGGAIVRNFSVRQLYRPETAAFIFPLINVVTTIPQWLLLRRYGSRSFVWPLLPLALSPVTSAMYRIARDQGIYSSIGQGVGWVVPTAASALVSGIVEAAALVWILEREFSPVPASSPATVAAPRKPEVPVDVSSQLDSVRVFLIGVLLLAAPIAVPQQFVQNYDETHWNFLLILFAAAVPWAVALGLLAVPRFRHAGFALAASASITALVPLVPLAGLSTMLAGFMLDNKDQWLRYFSMMALVVLFVAITIQSIRGTRRIPESAQSPWAWPAGFLGTMIYGFALYGAISIVEQRAGARRAEVGRNGQQAEANIKLIAQCAAAYAEVSPDKGFPRSLQELSSGGTLCLDSALASGEHAGHRYHYYPGLPDGDGVVRTYEACVEPIRYRETGYETIVIDESGKSSEGSFLGADSKIGISCAGAWRDAFRMIRFCATQYAAQHPDRGYPASLKAIAAGGNECLVRPWRSEPGGKVRENTWFADSVRLTYIAGTPDASGRVTTYEVHSYSGAANRLSDQTGTVYVATTADRLATPDDPVLSASARPIRIHIDEKTAMSQCAEGIVEACAVEAAHLAAGAHMEQATALYEKACAGGSGAACLWMETQLDSASWRGPRSIELLTKACDFGEPKACEVLSDRLMPTEPVSAKRLLLKACAGLPLKSKRCSDVW